MLELACDDVIFHFNKKHLQDPTVPMWILKAKGETYYVEHVDCRIGWSTKETPDNAHTKGAIKIKHCLLTIDDSNVATLAQLTEHDKIRLRNRDKGITRVVVSERNFGGVKLRDTIKQLNVKHGPIKSIGGACTTTFYVTDILSKNHYTMLSLAMSGTDFRTLKENEGYYKMYDDPKYKDREWIDEDEDYDEDSDDNSGEPSVVPQGTKTVWDKTLALLQIRKSV